MPETIDSVVIGAGVVGLAVARALALGGSDVLLLEKESVFGSGTSSRNSEVIHAGMYYPTGSLKAGLCVKGSAMLRHYLAEHHVEHRLVGKLIVATGDGEETKLRAILEQGRLNGVERLELWEAECARKLEPALHCKKALYSPLTGIMDSHGYMLALLGDLEQAGGTLVRNSPVLGGTITDQGILLSVGGAEPMKLLCRHLVNSAGLGAQNLARTLKGYPVQRIPPQHYCKGSYFLLSGKPPFSCLIYPLPDTASIGLHYTLDLGGQGRFGPDVEWVKTENYEVDPNRAGVFYRSIRKYWPELPDDSLRPGYSGIRPKIQGPDDPVTDFVVEGPRDHGIGGLVNLYGIKSPGLTASLALAELVAEKLQ